MAATNGSGTIAVVEDDLFFLSRIHSTLTKAGLRMVVVPPGEALPETATAVLIDLGNAGPWEVSVASARERGIEAIGFGPHIQGDLMRRARSAGCTRVMAKSKFVEELPRLASRWGAEFLAAHTVP